ncbi:MAG: amino acid permease [Cytophagales bacterium]|nr:amino acid permease [Cytophagales bacterium]
MSKTNKFGTFSGVFTPSILTIMGVIMYLRLPMIVGQAGLLATIGIIVVAHIISLSTGLSVSSIATDKKVKAGGTYYMISRSLGLPIGGTLGLALFVGLSFSVSLYLIGFSESFLSYWGFDVSRDNIRIAGSVMLLLVTTITFISTSLAIKTQYFIMAAIVLSLLSVFLGSHDLTPGAPLINNTVSKVPLVVLFGIFFPAVTGFEAGVSMSGDLKNPKKSIPIGSISAIFVGFVAYIGLALFFAYTVDGEVLANDSKVLLKISWLPQLVVAGIWGATLSSALGSILGAPRILQATAVDGISHKLFSRGVGKSNEPRNALLLTFLIAEAGILIGELDVIARVVSIFFITTYGFLNLSCAFERWTSVDFRPEFKTPIWISLIGAGACLLVMIQLDFLATIGASVILGSIFFLLKRKELTLQSGDTWSGVWASLVKSGLEYLSSKIVHNRNWRPNILLFHGASGSRPHLLQLGKDLCGKLGMLSAFELALSGQQTSVKKDDEQEEDKTGNYFSLKYTAPDIYLGIDEITRIYGFSGIKPNTVLMGWTKNENRQKEFGDLISSFNKSQLNSIFLNYNEKRGFGTYKNIDIWWSGYGSNLSMAISIIRYLSGGRLWKDVKIRLFVPVNNALFIERVYTTLDRIVSQYRIAIEINVVNNSVEKLSSFELIGRDSSDADLCIVGLPNRKYENMDSFMVEINKLLPLMGSTLLINASSQFEEYDLELSEKIAAVVKDEKIDLIPLPQFIFPLLTEEASRLDAEADKLVRKFYEKTFLPHFLESNDWIRNLKESIENTTQNFGKANEIEDQFRRNKAFFKIKNEFYYKITSLFEKKQSYKFNELKHITDKGIGWYLDELNSRVSSVSNNFRIEHNKISFKINRKDPLKLKWFKLWKKTRYPFAKKTIPVYVRYKDLSARYLKNQQIVALNQTILKFETWSYKFIHSLKTQINAIDDFIDQTGYKFVVEKLTKLQFEKAKTELLKELQQIEKDVKQQQTNLLKILLASFRREIVNLGYSLENIHINKQAKRKRIVEKVASRARKEILSFPEQWSEKAILYYNKLDSDIIMTSFYSRVLKLIDDYKSNINVNFYQRLMRDIKALITGIASNVNDLEKIREIKVVIHVDHALKVFRDFEILTQEVIKLVDGLPKEMTLPHENDSNKGNLEPVIVPISKITRHFFETRFIGQVADQLGKTEEATARLIHEINDQMNLTKFGIDNLGDESELGMRSQDSIIKDMIDLLNEKIKDLQIMFGDVGQQFENALEEAFEPLASYKIIESSSVFTSQLRGYQSRRIKDVLGYRTRAFGTSIMSNLAKVWYTKSEGVLLAKRLIETERNKSRNEKILDIVEQVTPSPKVVNNMPHYYKSLFSGRSNISEEFWVDMKREQWAFNKAIERYRSGIKGGIIITGERNCGKTTMCQYVLRKQFTGSKIFHIFPPVEGSIHVKDFERELGKVTGIPRSKSEIYTTLPYESVIVIHDLELWWQRSPDGFNVIEEIIHDVDRHSDSYLFVINMNIYTYELANNALNLQDHLIGVIQCQPFDSGNLKSLIMKRHQSSGLNFVLDNRNEESISQLRTAKLFTRYFDFTKGNPGVALNTWMSNITNYKNEQLFIRYPIHIDTDILNDLDEEAAMLLQQIELHKRVTIKKLEQIYGYPTLEIEKTLRPLRLNGLVTEKSEGVYVINPFAEPQVVRVLKQKELL